MAEIGRIDCGYCGKDSALLQSATREQLSVACPDCGTHILQRKAGQDLLRERMSAVIERSESAPTSAPEAQKKRSRSAFSRTADSLFRRGK
ncbi:MAG: hypothetical protein HOL04_02490 [Gammaproteobacteria bacterium]|jgi:DNA-directed RNA polymerase subunit RPC12/RpoP|nr:hypothetical protein [Gammaproteobacteria bacterium]MBT4608087.1 hypothetical protein [Thiotrichales bacterium]MBT3473276.1 hypothetical protein [Gammaproteobacteria bacterium]MBT3967373.1 hypothetical protein [Gammaproteobacteria bacterium]MBT4080426.1 hypothetical protein [Gammaproteobacteria bacterium]